MESKKTWLEQFLENYNGTSPEAKSLEKEIQQNYKGNSYIGWATMERLVYQQDADATFEIDYSHSGTPLFSQIINVSTQQIKDGNEISSSVDGVINFVKVKLTFLGKVFEEIYPVQDKDYSAPKFVDSNDVNKAVQRAKAKVASRATGIAYKLYEGNDLQFTAPEKSVIDKAIPKPVQEVKTNNALKDIATELIANYDKWLQGIKQINSVLIKKYNLSLEPNDTVEIMADKLGKIPNVELTIAQIKRLSQD